MEVTEYDKIFYTSAIEYLYNKFEIAGEFVKNNGMDSLPMSELSDMMIVSLKEWLGCEEGENWLSTIGYYKATISGVYCGEPHINLNGVELCSVCSGSFINTRGRVCERCGNTFCSPCVSVVDRSYDIAWCETCIETEGLTNILYDNE